MSEPQDTASGRCFLCRFTASYGQTELLLIHMLLPSRPLPYFFRSVSLSPEILMRLSRIAHLLELACSIAGPHDHNLRSSLLSKRRHRTIPPFLRIVYSCICILLPALLRSRGRRRILIYSIYSCSRDNYDHQIAIPDFEVSIGGRRNVFFSFAISKQIENNAICWDSCSK